MMARREVVPPPDIRIARGDVTYDRKAITDESGRVTGTVEGYRVCTRLERMWKRGPSQGGITENEYKAGSRFAEDWANCEAATRSCLNRDTGGDATVAILTNGARMNAADIRVRSAVTNLGAFLASVTVWTCVEGKHPKDWAVEQGAEPRTGMQVLRIALRKLVEHYGLDKP